MTENPVDVIRGIAFSGQGDNARHVVKMVANRVIGGELLSFYHAIDISDFSSLRCFISVSGYLFDVDFMSRHELIPPMSEATLPQGWDEWAQVKGNQLIVIDRQMFCSRMLTADSFVALPMYRFDVLADDVQLEAEGGLGVVDAVKKVLKSISTGYSFFGYKIDQEPIEMVGIHSVCLEAMR